MAIVAAAAFLGDVVEEVQSGETGRDQRGLYLQVQGNF
jgi:hypothetical protein